MTVIKKTIVLSKGATKGYVTIVKIGSQAGVKLQLNAMPETAQWLLIKIGNLEPIAYEVHTMQEEYALPHNFTAGDSIGVAVVNRQGDLYAFGGNRYGLDIPAFVANLKVQIVNTSDAIKEDNSTLNADNQEPKLQEIDVVSQEENTTQEAQEPIAKEIGLAPIVEVEDIIEPQLAEEPATKKKKATKPKSAKKTAEKKEAEVAEVVEGEAVVDASIPKDSSPNKVDLASNTIEEDNFNEKFSKTEINNFYSTIQSRLDEIFIINPKETQLAELIPDSKWVRVYYDKTDYYVVGVLSENGAVTHIAYGVNGVADILPPKEAMELCDFLPTDKEGNGYWLMFQRSDSGAVIKSADL